MKLFKALPTAAFLMASVAGAFIPTVASADEWNHMTTVTIDQPLAVPAVHIAGYSTLPPGTYVFKLMNSESNRHIVQIFNKDQTQILATILAIPNYRLHPTGKTVITFRERGAGAAPALRAWFYPGENFGEEFVYPKEEALQMAKDTSTAVLFTQKDLPNDVAEALPAEPAADMNTDVSAYQPSGQEVQTSEVTSPIETAQAEAQPPMPVSSPEPAAPATLPQTAGELPLIGVCGLLALAGGLVIRSVRRNVDEALNNSAHLRDEA